ncbi:catalase [Glaciimonas immobilis]|uniref:Catalase n=1 Tax=Glaciimonas immobilis TaxID=728004 RepID=A0A840RQI3_9BURK|nr:catalase [Glaciimonas immobilis]KAF3999379.1 catalase [Glaciimonas immobilis]MBB5198871.1 catalase [Glaciimonas immobilis]
MYFKATSVPRFRALWISSLLLACNVNAQTLTHDNGSPVGDNQNSQTAGEHGSTLLQDTQLIEKLQRFDRERIPERVVHARGTGAAGEFVAVDNLSALTSASLFATAGKKTPVFVRFSTVIHPKGSPETLRDPRGFATKFYTDQGNWDLVGNNLPVFFIRDAIKFPDMVHSLKPSPVTNVQDPNRFFDFFSHIPESTNLLTRVYSDLGIPASYRTMDGHGVHAFKMVTSQGDVTYVKFHWKSLQGVKSLTRAEAAKVQGEDFNNLTDDLYAAIKRGDFPKWDLYVQLMKPKDMDKFHFDPLDATKIWPDIPETKIGTMTLNKVPDNFFESTEMAAFAPSRLVPGIEPSEDKMLQGRLFAYADTQLHRLGPNNQRLPINQSLVKIENYNQDGSGDAGKRSGDVNYQPSHQAGSPTDDPRYKSVRTPLTGSTQQTSITKTDNFSQAGNFYRALREQDKTNLIGNLASDLEQVKSPQIKQAMLSYFYKADTDYGTRLTAAVKGNLPDVQQRAIKLID